MKHRRRRAPVSTLRADLSRRVREKEDWDGITEPDQKHPERPFLPAAIIVRMHRYLAVKITVAVVVVLLTALLYRGDYSWSKPLIRAIHYVSSADMDLGAIYGEAVPAFRAAWKQWNLPDILPGEEQENKSDSGHTADSSALPGELISNYGLRNDPLTGRAEMHYGVDLVAPIGTAVYAILEGDVRESSSGETGYTIILQHEDGWQTVYSYLDGVSLKAGDKVTAGQILGRFGEPSLWDKPHLHFELRYDGRPVPPPAAWLVSTRSEGTV